MAEHHYENFCLGDPLFYETPTLAAGGDFAIAGRPAPDGWVRVHSGDWVNYSPEEDIPLQGWKIHVSGLPATAEEVIETVWDYCVSQGIAFKFLPSEQACLLSNSKSADRSMSGKLVTIYPADLGLFRKTLEELGRLLEGQTGPYLLTDLRWGDGPLYVRYGAFLAQYRLDEGGNPELAVVNDRGELVPDDRRPVFKVPPWLTLPEFLAPHLAMRQRAPLQAMPYDIAEALHFSNAGGVYRGTDRRTGRTVVLKEARPFAALDADGTGAVTRLRHEREILERLDGVEGVPKLLDFFAFGEHEFLVREFVEGKTITALMVPRYPLAHARVEPGEVKAYATWALDIVARVERAVAAIHERGVTVGDLNPANILIREDGSPVLIDWEVAGVADDASGPALGTQGFHPAGPRPRIEVDRYALACLRYYLFLPLTELFHLDPDKPAQLAAEIARLFPIPDGYFGNSAALIGSSTAPAHGAARHAGVAFDGSGEDWLRARDAMVSAILASATPGRDDRLYPGDIAQFQASGGISFAHGAAGVLYALHAVGAQRQPEAEEWLVERAAGTSARATPGFYYGLSGIAYVLDLLGRHGDADRVLAECLGALDESGLEVRPISLFNGLAGIGLTFLHFAKARGDNSLLDRAKHIATMVGDRLAKSAASDDRISGGPGGHAGLMRGAAGPALFLVRLHELTGEGAFLDAAWSALRQDLRRCTRVRDSLQVNEGWRTMPYLFGGSAGIGMVLDRYLACRPDEALEAAAAAIERAAEAPFYAQSGLFNGRAGMMLFLAARARRCGSSDPSARLHISRLAWHALPFAGSLAFPGDRLLRLSMDLATGTAGVMLAWGAVSHSRQVGLPFLD